MARYKAYHGTGPLQAKEIEKNNFKIVLLPTRIDQKPNKVHWLGSGAYFFENDPNQAEKFAQLFCATPVVLECTIDVPDEQVFDVTDPESESVIHFEVAREIFLKNALNRKLNIKTTLEGLDQKIFDDICTRDGYQAVRAFTYTPFGKARELRVKSVVPNGIEICVRDNRLVVERTPYK